MEKQKKQKKPVDKIRKPTAPPTIPHGNKGYDRKEKHKKDYA